LRISIDSGMLTLRVYLERRELMRFLRTVLPRLLLPIIIICTSCGKSGQTVQEVGSLAEAKALATEKGSCIVVDFWRHG
jgi:hypothetical protein